MRKQRPQQHMPQPPPGRSGTGVPLPVAPPPGPTRYAVATDKSDAILPFLVSGGYTFWPSTPSTLTRAGVPITYRDYVAGDGAQLVTTAFIPWGKVGFLKEIRIAPLMPAILSDLWSTSGVTGADPAGAFGTYQAHRELITYTGLWDVPMGWESYDVITGVAIDGGFVPNPWIGNLAWQWSITVIDGTIPSYRTSNNIPPFDPLVQESWYLAESIPVPALVYGSGFPGRPVGVPQRMQVLPGDTLHTHAVIPGNSTICLWARWCQFMDAGGGDIELGARLYYASTADPANRQLIAEQVPVIGPSVGSLHGYTQPEVSAGSNLNATQGWGG